MLNWLKIFGFLLFGLIVAAVIGIYVTLKLSLPQLDGEVISPLIEHPATLNRDALGQSVITAQSRDEAMFLLGYAHAQDRFFQMDLQRRMAAGELAEWLGEAALKVDKANRFHQFRQRANTIFTSLPESQKQLLTHYSQGVNAALAASKTRSFEYLLTGFSPKPWVPEDSILTIFSMYLDLQGNNIKRDIALSLIEEKLGTRMVNFLLQSSQYQAAIDGSRVVKPATTPSLILPEQTNDTTALTPLDFSAEVGSNNWIVGGNLTPSHSALVANDMHLGLRVPIIWYRAQLNYPRYSQQVTVTGVTLPGVPGVIVGTNGHIAWGFTNSYIDVADWVRVADPSQIEEVEETLMVGSQAHNYTRLESPWGPVKQVDGQYYALQWVAHQPYAVDIELADLDTQTTVSDALSVIKTLGMPVQNVVIGDTQGNIAWTLAGAVPQRVAPQNTAVDSKFAQMGWQVDEPQLPIVQNPKHDRIWTANSRVVSAEGLQRFGDGGYALGARSVQIRDRLFDYQQFDEARFYQIQLDNEARFLQPWHSLLKTLLQRNSGHYANDLEALDNWGSCACAESIGYTLVRQFRQQLIASVYAPIRQVLDNEQLTFSPLLRYVEPGIWQLIRKEDSSWLPEGETDWQQFMLTQYDQAKSALQDTYGNEPELTSLAWGKVNALQVSHPFAPQIPFVGTLLNMPAVPGFGDSYMPAVQRTAFGASQRFFVQPGQLESAVLTLPGGQSGHPLSTFYTAGFEDYAQHRMTPLLPGKTEHSLAFTPQ